MVQKTTKRRLVMTIKEKNEDQKKYIIENREKIRKIYREFDAIRRREKAENKSGGN